MYRSGRGSNPGEDGWNSIPCHYYTFSYAPKVVLSYVAVAVFKLLVACFHLCNFSCANASLQVVVAKVEDESNLTIQSCSFTR